MAQMPDDAPTTDLEAILEAVYIYYGGDRQKVIGWLRTPHPALNGQEPMALLRRGETGQLVALVKAMIDKL